MQQEREKLPTMLFDGDCEFCSRWIMKWKRITGPKVHYAPCQEALAQFPQVTAQQCAGAIRLILPDGTVFAGAHAVFKALDLGGRYRAFLRIYETRPLCARLAEWLYQLVARNRALFSRFS